MSRSSPLMLMLTIPAPLLVLLFCNAAAVSSQLAWTQIYVGSNSENQTEYRSAFSEDDNFENKSKKPFKEDGSISGLKSIREKYCEYRETAKTLMYLIDSRDREKVSTWIKRLDKMDDAEGELIRLHYAKYMVATLSGSFGLAEPFTTNPPAVIQSLNLIIHPVVFADLMLDEPDLTLRKKKHYGHNTPKTNINSELLEDYKFFEQQLFPQDGIMCYAAAFSVI